MQKTHLAILYFLTFLCLSLTGYLLFQRSGSEEAMPQTAEQSLFITSKGSFRDSVKIFNLPDTLSFAGESVPITIPDVRERLERELYVNAYWESNMVLLMKRSTKFLPRLRNGLAQIKFLKILNIWRLPNQA